MGALSADVSLNLLARPKLAQTIFEKSWGIAVWAGERGHQINSKKEGKESSVKPGVFWDLVPFILVLLEFSKITRNT
jgi:hypothetical protein